MIRAYFMIYTRYIVYFEAAIMQYSLPREQ